MAVLIAKAFSFLSRTHNSHLYATAGEGYAGKLQQLMDHGSAAKAR
jgi:hypothetical protein